MEKRVLFRLIEQGQGVIATGGGAMMTAEIREKMLAEGIVIWLDAPAEVIYDRISNHTHRPLLQTENPKQRLVELLEQRKEVYNLAHIRVPSERVRINQTLDGLFCRLENYLISPSNQSKPR